MDVNKLSNTTEDSLWDFKGKIPYVDDWLFMGSPVPIVTILAIYLIGVLHIGPKVMKSRPPMNLDTIIKVYNIAQVIFSAFLVQTAYNLLKPTGLISRTCLLGDANYMRVLTVAIYYYHVAKITELLDTIFFVLRKKQSQVTFLHVYHHTAMVFITWTSLKYEPTDSVLVIGMVNSFIHIIMYSYYCLSNFPFLIKYLWWKKYITSMQLIQFGIVIIHQIINIFYGSCPPSYFLLTIIFFNTGLFVILFSQFYMESYSKKPAEVKAKSS